MTPGDDSHPDRGAGKEFPGLFAGENSGPGPSYNRVLHLVGRTCSGPIGLVGIIAKCLNT
jgi:hypothetical protein